MTPTVRVSDRWLVLGRTGSGKSVLARSIHAAVPPPRLVIDPADDPDALGAPYAVTFRDPSRLPSAPVARFVPRDPLDVDAYGAVYGSVWRARERWHVWLDEARFAAPSRGASPELIRHVTQGRHRGLGHVACSQRPVEVSPQLAAQADHVAVFALGSYPPDVALAGSALGLSPAELRDRLAALPPYGWLWLDVRSHSLGAADRVVPSAVPAIPEVP